MKKPAGRDFCSAAIFPHEAFDAAKCRHEIDELLEQNDLTQEQKQACREATP